MAEGTKGIELGEYNVEVSQEQVETLGYTHDGNGEVSYYTVTSDSDCLELMIDGVELSSTVSEQCDDVGRDEITILTADGQFITDGVGQLIHYDVDGTDAVANGQPLVLNLAHPMELTMPVVEYGKDDEELLNQSMKKYHHEISEENDGYSVIVTVPSDERYAQSTLVSNELDEDVSVGSSLISNSAKHSDDINQAWFTTKDDKLALQRRGHQWKRGQWTKDEIDRLQSNIMTYCQGRGIDEPSEIIFHMSKDERKDFYRTIAKGLHRPLFSVYRRVIRMYDERNYVGKYRPEEITQLRELRMKHGSDWASIGAVLGRSASSVKDRYRLMKDTCNSGKWFAEEEKKLAEVVYQLSGANPGESVTSGLSWAQVAEHVGTRSEKQCRTKWLNYLNWKQKGGAEWTRNDDILLINKLLETEATEESAVNWKELSDHWPSVRSPQWLRGKWWSMKRHIRGYQDMTFPEVLEQVKLLQLQSVSFSHSFLSALIPLPPEPDDSNAEHFDWTQLWRSGVTINLPFSGTVGEDSGDATTTKLEDASNNTFVLASHSEFDSSTSAVYEVSGISSDEVVFQADPQVEEVENDNLIVDEAEELVEHDDKQAVQDFRHEFSTLSEGNLEIVDEMGIVADEETAVEVADGSHVRDVTIKSEEINGSYVAVVQLDNGLTQVIADDCMTPSGIGMLSRFPHSSGDNVESSMSSFSDPMLTLSTVDVDDVDVTQAH